eukprot:9417621-Pyramimonas_sp.AAC.1
MMEHGARLWGGFWSASEDVILRLGDAMPDLRAVATEHVKDLPPITAPCIQACNFSRRRRLSALMGGDLGRWLSSLPRPFTRWPLFTPCASG